MSIIDARVRLPQDVRPEGRYSAHPAQLEQYDKRLRLSEKLNESTIRDLLDSMEADGISLGVMHAESEGGEKAHELNESLAEVMAQHEGRFIGVGCVDSGARYPKEMLSQAKASAAMGFVGVSIQPAFASVDMDDRRLYPLYAYLEDHGLILAVHTGINYSRLHPMSHESPARLDRIACDFPDLRIMACHAGWPWTAEIAAVALRHPTIYLEFGALAPRYVAKQGAGWDTLFGLMPNLLSEQILYGSDWPVMSQNRAIQEWRESGLDPDTLTRLFESNARRLFRVDD